MQNFPASPERTLKYLVIHALILLTFSEPEKLMSNKNSVVPVWGSSKLTRAQFPKTYKVILDLKLGLCSALDLKFSQRHTPVAQLNL